MSWFSPARFKVIVDLLAGFKVAGTEVTATAAELNILDGVTKTAAEINALVAGAAGGYKVARIMHTTVAASDDVNTGLATVVAALAVLEDAPGLDPLLVQAVVGDQAGTPAAGHVLVNSWKATAANDATPIAATTFGKKISVVAIGT